ncbi:hypothetical protein BO443_10091 [Burkholderia orbicola]
MWRERSVIRDVAGSGVQVDLAFEHGRGGAGHHQRGGFVARAVPADRQRAAVRVHGHGRIEQAAPDAGRDRRARAGAARERLARAAFVHAQLHFTARHDLHEAGVHALREARMALDQRAFFQHRIRFDVVDDLHRVRIAHRHRRNPARRAAHVERPQRVVAFLAGVEARGIERHLRRREHGRAHVDDDFAVVLQRQRDQALHDLHAHAALVGQAAVADELHETACAVAAVFDLAAVAIEDPVLEIRAVDGRFLDQQQLVGADAEVAVGECAHLRFGERRQRARVAVEHDEVVARAVHLGEREFHWVRNSMANKAVGTTRAAGGHAGAASFVVLISTANDTCRRRGRPARAGPRE